MPTGVQSPGFLEAGLAFDEEGYFVEVVWWHGALFVLEDVRPSEAFL